MGSEAKTEIGPGGGTGEFESFFCNLADAVGDGENFLHRVHKHRSGQQTASHEKGETIDLDDLGGVAIEHGADENRIERDEEPFGDIAVMDQEKIIDPEEQRKPPGEMQEHLVLVAVRTLVSGNAEKAEGETRDPEPCADIG